MLKKFVRDLVSILRSALKTGENVQLKAEFVQRYKMYMIDTKWNDDDIMNYVYLRLR